MVYTLAHKLEHVGFVSFVFQHDRYLNQDGMLYLQRHCNHFHSLQS